jgi:hypothetical protein
MFRTALRAVLLIGVVAAPAWAGSQSGTYSATSKHYGKTIASVPGSFYSVKVTLEYAGGGFDELVYPQPKVTVSCETLALESATVTPTTFGSGGGSAKLDAKISSPVASITSVRAKITVSSKVSPLGLTLSSGTAKSGVWSGTYAVPANPSNSTLTYVVTFEATDDKGTVTTLTSAPPLSFVSSTPKAPVLPTSTAVPAPTLRH